MENILKPKRYYKNIFKINYDLLKKEKIKYLLFDLDNTIAETKISKPSKEIIELFTKLKKQGFIPIILTNALPLRANRFAKILDIEAYSISRKPNKHNYLKIMKKYNINNKSIAAIGDQIYTDIKGANKLGIKSIFLDRISKRESIFTIPNRIRENKIVFKKIIKKGDYYE